MHNNNFNIIITGVGGQGLITLLQVIDEAAFIQGYEVRSSELHGLSQRGGSVEAHIRFGKKVYSPLVLSGTADLVIGLEMLEGLREFPKSGKNTKFLINKYSSPFPGSLKAEEIEKYFKSLQKENLHLVPASDICKEKLQNEVVSTLYLLGYAVNKNLIPLKEESVLKAIEIIMPKKYLELNIKAFNLSKNT
jgi:indolepyruvate ferredoxin oxidoreductase, beta subunit